MLPAFMADYNARFAKEPADAKDLHRPLAPSEDLNEAFAWREERTVSGSLTLQYDKVLFLLEPTPVAKGLKRKKVTVADPDGRLKISHGGIDLPYKPCSTRSARCRRPTSWKTSAWAQSSPTSAPSSKRRAHSEAGRHLSDAIKPATCSRPVEQEHHAGA